MFKLYLQDYPYIHLYKVGNITYENEYFDEVTFPYYRFVVWTTLPERKNIL